MSNEGPVCCTDDCCGPGSYCCSQANPHTHTEPASDVTLVQALRVAADYMEGPNGKYAWAPLWLRKEADHLEAAQATREADIRIGRALHKVRNAVNWGKSYTDEWYADYGRTAREAVDAERGQA